MVVSWIFIPHPHRWWAPYQRWVGWVCAPGCDQWYSPWANQQGGCPPSPQGALENNHVCQLLYPWAFPQRTAGGGVWRSGI